MHLYAALGYVVVYANPRGSNAGRGVGDAPVPGDERFRAAVVAKPVINRLPTPDCPLPLLPSASKGLKASAPA